MIGVDPATGALAVTISLPTLVAVWRFYEGIKKEFRRELKDELDKKSNKTHEKRAEEIMASKSDRAHEEVCKIILAGIQADLIRGRDQFKALGDKIDRLDRTVRENGKGYVTTKDIDRLIEAVKT